MKSFFISLIIFCSTTLSLFAQQDNRNKTEEAVNAEEKFTEAQREMLIGKTEKAIKLYEEMYREDRTNASVSFELAKIYRTKMDHIQAEKYAKVAADNAPSNKWMVEFYADFLLETNKPTTALLQYRNLAALYPEERFYYQRMVDCNLRMEKVNEAIAVYNTMEQKLGGDEEIFLSRFELYEKSGDKVNAALQLDKLIAKYGGNKKHLKTKARFLTKNGKITEAVEVYKKVLELDAEDTDANLAILSKGDDKEKPNAYLMSLLPIITNQSINIDVKVKELMPYVQNLALGNNMELKAALIELTDKLVLTHPDEAKAYSLSGDVLINCGDMAGGIEKYEKTLKLNNKVFAVWEQLMYAYNEQLQYDQLYKTANTALDLFPNQAINYYFLSLASSEKNNYKNAVDIAQEGLVVSGGNKVNVSKINVALAKAYLGMKDYVKAQTAIDAANTASENKNSQAIEVQGDLYAAKGDKDKATESWKKAIQMGNHSIQLKQKLESFK